jgi:hypothetical protein
MQSSAICSQLGQTSSLPVRQASTSCLRGAGSAQGAPNARRGICSKLPNRELSTIASNSSPCTKLGIMRISKTGECLRG